MRFRNNGCCNMQIGSTVVLLALLSLSPFAAAQAANPQASPTTGGSHPARVRVKLEGFDIAPKSGKAPNQIGGASRGIGGITLYAPRMGKAYSLTPTFYWSSDDPTLEYTFKISAMSAEQSPLYSTKVTGGQFTYPAAAPPLEPGETYGLVGAAAD